MEEVSKSLEDKASEALEKESALKAKPEAKTKPPKVEVEVEFSYITKDREPPFKVLYPGGGWRPSLQPDGRLMWKISASEKDRFEAHHHFQVGRIIRHD